MSQPTKTCIPWIGGKAKLIWLIDLLLPPRYQRFIDVFGGGGTVTFSRPNIEGSLKVYNDFNCDLVNFFSCVKNRPMELIHELNFLPLNSRDEFDVLCKFLSGDEFDDPYMEQELELVEQYFDPPEQETLKQLIFQKTDRNEVKRAADYFKQLRYSYCGGGKSFAGKGCDIRRFFHEIWACSRYLNDTNVVLENKDFDSLIRQYDRDGAVFYCDPPYYKAEDCYAVEFGEKDHIRLRDTVLGVKGYVMISYNYCERIMELYRDHFYIFYTTRPNSMSQTPGSLYEEIILTNYDPRLFDSIRPHQMTMFDEVREDTDGREYKLINEPTDKTYIRSLQIKSQALK